MTVKREQGSEEIGEVFGVDEQTVRRWCGDGCPHSRRKNKLFMNDGEVQAWLTKEGRSTKPGRPPKEKTDTPLENDKDYWLARKYKNQCLRDEGELVSVSEVKSWIGSHVTTAKNKLIGLGAAVTPMLEGRDAAERQEIIDRRVAEILNELAAT